MPKKKITLEEAFAVFEREGLQVKVEAMQPQKPQIHLEDFLEDTIKEEKPAVVQTGKRFVKITLYASHSIGNGGEMVVSVDGTKHVINNGVETYGPGVITVPVHLAQHLLHQDMLARRADERTFDHKLRSFAVFPQQMPYGTVNAARLVSTDSSFNIASFVTNLPTMYQI